MPATLTTPRFSLRPFAESDVEQFSFIDDASFRKYLFNGFPDRDEYVANNLVTDWSEEFNFARRIAARVSARRCWNTLSPMQQAPKPGCYT